jgi:periplasmic protein TonB
MKKITTSITARVRYGAAELKAAYNRNLALALTISVAVHVGAIGLYLTTSRDASARKDHERVRDLPPITIDQFEINGPKDAREGSRGGGPVDVPNGEPTKVRATDGFNPLITEDTLEVSTNSFPTVSEIPSTAVGDETNGVDIGNGQTFGDPNGSKEGTTSAVAIEKPKSDVVDATADFHEDLQMPAVNMRDLAARVVYPRMASEHDIEGTVYVKALIGLDGAVESAVVESSTQTIFNDAALKAVRETQFTVGMQNQHPVRVWMIVPIRFQLD